MAVSNAQASSQVGLTLVLTAAESAAGVTPVNYGRAPLDIRRYGADPSGTTDSGAAIMAAVAVAYAQGGGRVFYPDGNYLVNSAGGTQVSYVYNNVYHEGASPNGVTVVNAATNLPAFTVGNGATQVTGGGIAKMQFSGKFGVVAVNGQTGFTVEKVDRFVVRDVYVVNLLAANYRGAFFSNCSQYVLDNLQVQGCLLDGITNISGNDVYAVNCRSDSNGGAGWSLSATAGGYYCNCTAYGNQVGSAWYLVSGSPSTAPNSNNFFVNCIGDTSGQSNWLISDSADSYWINCWGSSQASHSVNVTASGFLIESQYCTGCFFTGCIAINNNGTGFEVFDSGSNAPTNIHFVNCQGGSPGFGGSAFGNGKGGSGGYGLNFSGASNHIRVVGGSYENNATAGINNGSSAADITIAGNPVGFVASNQGTNNIAIGNSSVAVTHGLGYTPSTFNISVTPISSQTASGITAWWISATSATTFTVSSNTTVSSAQFTFAWKAQYNGA
jgi:hypothetical protein